METDKDKNERLPLDRLLPLKAPLTIHIEVTNKCNFRCVFCPESDPEYPNKVGGFQTISSKEFERIAENIEILNIASREAGGDGVAVIRLWIMGEPLLNRDIFNIISIIKKRGLSKRLELTTNGSALTKDNSIGLILSGLDTLKVSIYGFNEKQYQITGTKISSEKILSNIKTFLSERSKCSEVKPKLVIKMVDPTSPQELEDFKSIYSDLADKLEINAPHAWTEGAKVTSDSSCRTDEELNIKSFSVGHVVNFIRGKSERPMRKEGKKICAFPFYTLAIHVSGDVSPCCVDWEKKLSLGNINEESLSEIWNGPKIQNLRMGHLTDSVPAGCVSCEYYVDNCPESLDASAQKLIELYKNA
jgi:radical SAM protein with 4Fe4S-binding SPASM domain